RRPPGRGWRRAVVRTRSSAPGPGGTGAPPGPVAGSADGEVVDGGLVLLDRARVHLRLAVDGDRERVVARPAGRAADGPPVHLDGVGAGGRLVRGPVDVLHAARDAVVAAVDVRVDVELAARSEERRVGKEGSGRCRTD